MKVTEFSVSINYQSYQSMNRKPASTSLRGEVVSTTVDVLEGVATLTDVDIIRFYLNLDEVLQMDVV